MMSEARAEIDALLAGVTRYAPRDNGWMDPDPAGVWMDARDVAAALQADLPPAEAAARWALGVDPAVCERPCRLVTGEGHQTTEFTYRAGGSFTVELDADQPGWDSCRHQHGGDVGAVAWKAAQWFAAVAMRHGYGPAVEKKKAAAVPPIASDVTLKQLAEIIEQVEKAFNGNPNMRTLIADAVLRAAQPHVDISSYDELVRALNKLDKDAAHERWDETVIDWLNSRIRYRVALPKDDDQPLVCVCCEKLIIGRACYTSDDTVVCMGCLHGWKKKERPLDAERDVLRAKQAAALRVDPKIYEEPLHLKSALTPETIGCNLYHIPEVRLASISNYAEGSNCVCVLSPTSAAAASMWLASFATAHGVPVRLSKTLHEAAPAPDLLAKQRECYERERRIAGEMEEYYQQIDEHSETKHPFQKQYYIERQKELKVILDELGAGREGGDV